MVDVRGLRALGALGVLSALLAIGACCNQERERVAVVAGPGLTVAPKPVDANLADAGLDAAEPELLSPVTATFIDLGSTGAPVRFRACEQVIVAVTRGHARALDDELAVGDMLFAQGSGGFDVKGDGVALLAAVRTRVCDLPLATGITKRVVRATAAPRLTWAEGKMHAHLDAEGDASPLAYVGRLGGTAAVAEHRHDGSWEILGAIGGSGTFTIDGKPQRLGPRQIVIVPPNTPHSWKPDDGVALSAVQLYSPPGPEQRFKSLAAAGNAAPSDAGAGDAGASVTVGKPKSPPAKKPPAGTK